MAKKSLAEKLAENSKSVVNTIKTNTIGGFSTTENIKKNIVILDELQNLIPPLLDSEFAALRDNLQKHGCKDPLKVWQTTNGVLNREVDADDQETVYVLIDGHNRFRLCNELQIPFNIQVDNFESMKDVRDFMIDFQLSRRNITSQQASYLRGLRYNNEKKIAIDNLLVSKETEISEESNPIFPNGQNDHSTDKLKNTTSDNENLIEISEESNPIFPNGQNDHSTDKTKKTTAQELGEYFNVGEKTIRRDADFARGLDKLDPKIRKEVLAGKKKVEKAKIQKIGTAQEVTEVITSLDEVEDIYKKITSKTNESEPVITEVELMNDELIRERFLSLTEKINSAYESKSAKEIDSLKIAFNKFLEILN